MLQKWKTILTNWINCYFNESDSKEKCLTVESLLNIISHLRENLSLDESKSSILEAHTVEEFIHEKYPEFKFNNGTVEAETEEELYLVASLLLLFVCVNSKDVNIKTAMCSKLSISDQEVILKFSKCLMECVPINYKDVQAAINEACGHDAVVTELNATHGVVAETPPALRSLHGEVRRLQAALDAERFDRNYLQEELSRTNMKLEKLLKDKEQYKMDIVNLKAKISMCCGQESDTKVSGVATVETAKLIKQLEQMEEKLVETQGQLDDTQYERDTYRAKVNELKHERDQLVKLNQQETSKNNQLSEDLESERRTVNSLRELVTELRQHQQLNRLDSSQLECDDPDASIHSLQHNSSVCSEACANVVEVQLGEERAKITLLMQQIQKLQEQLNEVTQKSGIEKLSLEKIISEKDNDIFNLKHRINEEIEIKNNMTVHYSDEVSKLNNEINEIEQKLKDNNVQSTLVIETKMQEIQTLQEEKFLLLQSLHDETTKLDNIAKNLKIELSNEKTSKSKMKEEYENRLMKLKEKVLNRNNELVELQNTVVKLSEQIEGLHLDLRQEKQKKDEMIQQYRNELELVNSKRLDAENKLQQTCIEVERLTEKLNNSNSCIDQLNTQIDYLKGSVSQLTETCNILEQNKTSLVMEIEIRDNKLDEKHKEVDNWRNKVAEERDTYNRHISDYEMKIATLTKTIDETREEMTKQKESYTAVLDSRSRDIQTLQQENQSLNNELNDVKLELDQKVHSLKEKLTDNETLTEKLRTTYESQIENLNLIVNKLTNFLKDKTMELESFKKEKERLQEIIDSNNEVINVLEEEVKSQKHNHEKLTDEFESERLVLKNMITVTESVMEDQRVSLNQIISDHERDKKSLNKEIEELRHTHEAERSDIESKLQKKEAALEKVIQQLSEVVKQKDMAQKDYEKEKERYSYEIDILNEEIRTKQIEIDSLEIKHKDFIEDLQKCRDDIAVMKDSKEGLLIDIEVLKEQNKTLATEITHLEQQYQDANNMLLKSSHDITTLQENNSKLINNIDSLKDEIELKVAKIESLELQNKELQEKDEIHRNDMAVLEENNNELKSKIHTQETELLKNLKNISQELNQHVEMNKNLEDKLEQKNNVNIEIEEKLLAMRQELATITEQYNQTLLERNEYEAKFDLLLIKLDTATAEMTEEIVELRTKNIKLLQNIEDSKLVLKSLLDNIRVETQNNYTVNFEKEDFKVIVNELVTSTEQKLVEMNERIAELHTDNSKLLKEVEESKFANKSLQDKIEHENEIHEKAVSGLEAEKMVLQKKLAVSLSVIEEQKQNQKNILTEQFNVNDILAAENKTLKEAVNNERRNAEIQIKEKQAIIENLTQELADVRIEKEDLQKHLDNEKNTLGVELNTLKKDITLKLNQIEILESQNKDLETVSEKIKKDISTLEETNIELIIQKDKLIKELENSVTVLNDTLQKAMTINTKLTEDRDEFKTKAEKLEEQINKCVAELNEEIAKLKEENYEVKSVKEDHILVIKSLENKLQMQKEIQEQQTSVYESEKDELLKLISNNEAVIEEYKINITKLRAEFEKANNTLNDEIVALKKQIENERTIAVTKTHEKETVLEIKVRKLYEIINEKDNQEKVLEIERDSLSNEREILTNEIAFKVSQIKELENLVSQYKNDIKTMEENNNELKIRIDSQETEFSNKLDKITEDFNKHVKIHKQLEQILEDKHKLSIETEEKVNTLNNQVVVLTEACNRLEQENKEYKMKIENLETELVTEEMEKAAEISKLREENAKLTNCNEDNKQVISKLKEMLKHGNEQIDFEKVNINSKCSLLEEYQIKAEKELENRQKEIIMLEKEVKALKIKIDEYEQIVRNKDDCIHDTDKVLVTVKQELAEEKAAKKHLQIELEAKEAVVRELNEKLDNGNSEDVKAIRNEEWVRAVGQREIFAVAGSEKTSMHKYSGPHEKDYRDFYYQVDNTTSDLAHSSMDSIKTISDLEKIIHDKNRTITALQSDITYLKSLIADSETKVLDVSKDLEASKENCQQLSSQLKKIVNQKNEEIAELKKQVTKMSVTENRASQIIKVSAKYQAIILKRIAEIKTNTVLKELTNFGNSANGDNDLRRSLNVGTITMEDLENFLETTDKHLRRCSEKQIILQKERDRLSEVNRINESEIINLKKFLTELSVSFKTFSNVKELYTHKFSRVVAVQRTVRREILSLDGRINDATMCKLERGYAAVMQDLSEAVMNMERWVERSISRTISPEKIKQAFMSDEERSSLANTTFQNTSLEVQIAELENSFQKLLEEVVRAQKGEGAKDAQAITIMELRAEYEDKLNRMKAKMKQLYLEQVSAYKDKQKEEIATLERELMKTREKLSESSKAYEEHISALTTELWRVGEKFLTKKDELEWLKKRQMSGSLMSLQHVHSSGLVAPQGEVSRISDAHSLRSLPISNNTKKREGRGLHMSDEEGEVFDNRWLQQLAATPRRGSPPQRSPGARLSELRWRNSFCPPHLKSSYPAETQFAPALDEEDIKCLGAASLGGRNQRKEVGITAYKKPGPPTPSKQAGRLSATDSELRESLRFEPEPQVSRKTSTPSRLRSLFRSNKNDTADGTPRSKRLSIFRKK